MGLIKGEVKLEQYDIKWQADFLAEKAELEKLFGEVALEIEHIGSTSVRGLSAKPIIDIAVAVNSLRDFAAIRPKFEELKQYSIKDDGNNPGEILIRKHGETQRKSRILSISWKKMGQNTKILSCFAIRSVIIRAYA